MSIPKKIALFAYLLVNSFFVLKYGDRQPYISTNVILIIYNVFVVFLLTKIFHFQQDIDNKKRFNFIFLSVSFFVFIAFVIVNFLVDGNSLNIDRWSAMETTVQGILQGQYPYELKDHLGKTSSNLPGLFYIGLPFYLIGNVGYLQAFVFLIGCYLLYTSNLKNTQKVVVVVLFLLSPAYLWEIVAKSDLLSNILILVFFLFLWDDKQKHNYFEKPILLAFCCSFLFFTRGIVIIPLIFFLFGDFLKLSIQKKIIFLSYCLFFLILISLPVLLVLPDVATLKEHNPFNHQTRFTPFWVQVLFVFSPLLIAHKIQSIQNVVYYTFLNFFLLLFLSFIIEILDENFYDSLYKSYFDISYLTMILPFAILVIIFDTRKKAEI